LKKQSEVKCGSVNVNIMKRVSAFLLGAAALALCLTPNLATAQLPKLLTIDLGSAATFAVLGGQTVTNTGLTIVNGDLGVWPGSAVTGFGPGVVNGSIQAGVIAAQHAQASSTIAYNDAAGRSVGPVGVAGDLGGRTLTPGLYKSTSTLAVTGDLTLHGQGVYIFQIASGLTVHSGSRVVLTGGARAADVFWQVGSSATLGTTSAFKGTILALTSISLATGATLDGSALAQHGSVTLDTNAVAKQATNTVTTIPRHDD
jgi:Ice-binding-like